MPSLFAIAGLGKIDTRVYQLVEKIGSQSVNDHTFFLLFFYRGST